MDHGGTRKRHRPEDDDEVMTADDELQLRLKQSLAAHKDDLGDRIRGLLDEHGPGMCNAAYLGL